MNETTIRYLLFFFKYLDEEVFKNLIYLVFGKSDYCFSNFTYKEFFLNILLNDIFSIDCPKKYTEQEILADKKKLESLNLEYDIDDMCENNSFYRLKLLYSKEGPYYIESDDIAIKWLKKYNKTILSGKNIAENLLTYMTEIANSLSSYNF